VNQPGVEIPIVLALQANPDDAINFGYLELQPHELKAIDSPELAYGTVNIGPTQARLMPDIDGDNMELEQSGDPNVTNNLHVGISQKKTLYVGMVLLPETLDSDLALKIISPCAEDKLINPSRVQRGTGCGPSILPL
jgi:hypothetical protein